MKLPFLLSLPQIFHQHVKLILGLFFLPQFSPGLKVNDLIAPQLVDLHGGGFLLKLFGPVQDVVVRLELLKSCILLCGMNHFKHVVLVLLMVNQGLLRVVRKG